MAASKPPKGRKPLGNDARTRVLQIRLTEKQFAKIHKLGGSAWAREILTEAIKGKR